MGWLGQMLDQVGWLYHIVTWLTLISWLGQMLDQVGWLCYLVTWLNCDELVRWLGQILEQADWHCHFMILNPDGLTPASFA